ncbi:hypothetical protein SpCBS45565_g06441 [Spizellomyces sp. 'palustris']|nr:hypothetical protein SpCBS45565_g06441 [Spizellomyces sp. 'palustris']
MTHPLPLRSFNLLVYVFFVSSSLYNVIGPDPSYGYAKYPTYLTPAPWAYAIWAVIYLLFGGFVIWQWFPETDDVVIDAYGSWFIIASLCGAVWQHFWETGHLVLALIVLLFASAAVTIIYTNLHRLQGPLFVIWINIFAIIARATEPRHPSILQKILVFFALFQMTATAVAYTETKRESGDLPGAFTIAWALFAVSAGQKSKFVKYSALVMGVVVAVHAFRPLVRRRRDGERSQRESLLGEGEESREEQV